MVRPNCKSSLDGRLSNRDESVVRSIVNWEEEIVRKEEDVDDDPTTNRPRRFDGRRIKRLAVLVVLRDKNMVGGKRLQVSGVSSRTNLDTKTLQRWCRVVLTIDCHNAKWCDHS